MATRWGEQGGRIVHVDATADCMVCTCPGCGRPLSPRRVGTPAAHFAHTGGPACATGASEAMRRLAVQAFSARLVIALPPLALTGFVGDMPVSASRPVARDQPFDLVLPSLPCGELVPDAVGLIRDRRLAVAFTAMVPPGPEAARQAEEAGIALLDVDVRDASALEPDGTEDWMLLSAPRRWLWHPWLRDMEAEMAGVVVGLPEP